MENCIFCNIVAGSAPSTKVYEDEHTLAFKSLTPGTTLLIPKAHYRWFQDLPDELSDHLFRVAKTLAKQFTKEAGVDYVRLMIVGEDVPHVHVHLTPSKL